MRIVALGGAGGMGQYAVRTIIEFDFVESVVIADLDGERARALADDLGPKAQAAECNVEYIETVEVLLSGADAVLNTVGPFYRFGVPILKAAIDARCDYLDINDDWEPTLEMLALQETADKAGITAVIGIGASPGVSNLLAAKAIAQLDTVQDVTTGWSFGDGDGAARVEQRPPKPIEPSAALVHWMHQSSGKIRIRRAGEFVDVSPIEEVLVAYPGLGTGKAWTVGHPEAVTLPRWKSEIANCANVMAGSPRVIEALRQIAKEIDGGRMSVLDGARLLTGAPPGDPYGQDASRKDNVRLPPLFATASGTKDGAPALAGATVLAMPTGGMGGSTGVPMAIGLKLLAEGKIDGPGVFAPEQVIDPDRFFDELAPLCTPPKQNHDDMILVTTSER